MKFIMKLMSQLMNIVSKNLRIYIHCYLKANLNFYVLNR